MIEEFLDCDGDTMTDRLEQLILQDPVVNRCFKLYDKYEDLSLTSALAMCAVYLAERNTRLQENISKAIEFSTPKYQGDLND